jgi:hypothetical protein
MLAHVDLAETFADGSIDQREAALPAGALLLHAAQSPRVELELRIVERLRQVGGVRVDEVEGHVVLPRRERLAVEQPGAIANRGRLVDDEVLHVAETDAAEHELPVDVRHELLEPGQIHRIDGFADFAPTLRRPRDRGDLVLDADHALRRAGRILVAEQLEDLGDVRSVRSSIGVELFALLQVVVAVRHAEPSLTDPRHVPRGIHRVGVDAHGERRLIIDRADELHQAGSVLHRCNLGQVRLQRFEPACLDSRLVHPAGVQVRDLLVDATSRRLAACELIEDGVQIGLRLLEHNRAGPVAGAVRRHLKTVEPLAVDVAIEVVARLDARVHLREVDTETTVGRLRRRRGCSGCWRLAARNEQRNGDESAK